MCSVRVHGVYACVCVHACVVCASVQCVYVHGVCASVQCVPVCVGTWCVCDCSVCPCVCMHGVCVCMYLPWHLSVVPYFRGVWVGM